MILDNLYGKALAALTLLAIGTSIGGWGGYRIGHAAADRAAAAAATQLARDNAATVARLRSDTTTAVAAVQAKLDQQSAATAQWLARNAQLATQVSGLQQEINHVTFRSVSTPAVAGVCPGDPLADPAWGRLYDRAASAGAAAAPPASARPSSG